MIGSESAARAALAGDLTYLDEGTSRRVYRDGNVVYKIETFEFSGIANKNEYEAYLEFIALNDDNRIAVPETSLYTVDGTDVIAMEYIDGQLKSDCFCIAGVEKCMPDCLSDDEKELVNGWIGDTGGFNVIEKDGILYIIDLEC